MVFDRVGSVVFNGFHPFQASLSSSQPVHCHPSTRPRHIKAAEHITLQVHCIAFPDFHRSLSLGFHNRSKGRCEKKGGHERCQQCQPWKISHERPEMIWNEFRSWNIMNGIKLRSSFLSSPWFPWLFPSQGSFNCRSTVIFCKASDFPVHHVLESQRHIIHIS